MTIHRVGRVAAAVSAVVLLALVGAPRAQQPGLTITRGFALVAPVRPQRVYRLVPLYQTAAEVRTRALRVGLQPASVTALAAVGRLYAASDPAWTWVLDTDRQLESLVSNRVLSSRYGRSLRIPDAARCRNAAVAFLQQRQIAPGTAAEGLVYERTNDLLRSYRAATDRGPAAPPVVQLREVVFAKTIEGVPCTGPGTHLSVFIGDQGRVLGYVSNWMPAVPTDERVEVAPATVAFDQLRQDLTDRDSRIPDPRSRAVSAEVRQCRYVLLTQADRAGQVLALPGFEYRGQVLDQQHRALSFRQAVLAPGDRRALLRRLAPEAGPAEPAPRGEATPQVRPNPDLRPQRPGGAGPGR